MGSTSFQPAASGQQASLMHRVKLYKLNTQGLWDDKGTGHVAMEFLPKPAAPGLVVVGEADYKILLVHKLCSPEKYTRQGENTIITWLDDDIGTDVALSFQEEDGCAAIWDRIQGAPDAPHNTHAGGSNPTFGPQLPTSTAANGETASALHSLNMASAGASAAANAAAAGAGSNGVLTASGAGGAGGMAQGSPAAGGGGVAGGVVPAPQQRSAVCIKLPWPEVRTLPDINKALNDIPLAQRERVAMNIHNEGHYLPRLLEVFSQCEDIDDRDALSHLYSIIKCLIMMNDMQLVEQMVSDQFFWGVVGALEYDPDLTPNKAEHRSFLKNVVTFKEVVDIPDEATKSKIHATFRIAYIRDAVLPRALDDASFAALHTTMIFNYMDILASLQQSPAFFQTLFEKLRTVDIHSEQASQLMSFLQEVCHLTAHPNCGNRAELMALFMKENILDVLARGLSSSHPRASSKAMEVILMLIQSDVAAIRAAILDPPHTMLAVLIQQLLGDDEHGLPEQALEALKYLLDPESMDFTTQRNAFLELFYNEFMERIVNVIAAAGRALTPPAPCNANAAQLAGVAAGSTAAGSSDAAATAAVAAADGDAAATAATGDAAASETTAAAAAAAAPQRAAAAAAAAAACAAADAAATESPTAPASSSQPSFGEGSTAQQGGSSWGWPQGSNSVADAVRAVTAEGVKSDVEELTVVPPPFVLALVLDLMQYCVTHHHFRIKYFVLRHTIIHKVLKLLKSPKRWLAVGALRFFRTCVGLKDEFYNRYITKNELFREPLDAFLENGDKPNLLNSTFLEMMEFMRSGDQSSLLLHFVDRYWNEVEGLNYVSTFHNMRETVDKMQVPGQFLRSSDREACPPLSAGQRNARELSRDEEAYFSEATGDDEDDEDSEKAAESPHARGASDGSGRAMPQGLANASERGTTTAMFSAHMGRAGMRLGGGDSLIGRGSAEDADRAGGLSMARSISDRFSGGAFAGLVPYADDDDDIRGVPGTDQTGSRPQVRVGPTTSHKAAAASLFNRSPAARGSTHKGSNWFPQHLSKPAAGAGASASPSGGSGAGVSGTGVGAHHPAHSQPGQLAAQLSGQNQPDTAPGSRDGTFREHSSDHGAAHCDSLLQCQSQNVLLRIVPPSASMPLTQADWTESDRDRDAAGLLWLRTGSSAPSCHGEDTGSHMMPISLPDSIGSALQSSAETSGRKRAMRASHAAVGQPVTTGAQHTGAQSVPIATQQASLGFRGPTGMPITTAAGMAVSQTPGTSTGTPLPVQGVPESFALPQGNTSQAPVILQPSLMQIAAGQPAEGTPTHTATGHPSSDHMAGLPAGLLSLRTSEEQGVGVPVPSIGEPAVPQQQSGGQSSTTQPPRDAGDPPGSADATGAAVPTGEAAGALLQPQIVPEASSSPSSGVGVATGGSILARDTTTAAAAATQPASSGASAPTALAVSAAPAVQQLVGVQGSVAQGLPVPDAIPGNENISIPMVATGVPVSDASHITAGSLSGVDVSGVSKGEIATEESGRGAGQKRIADVDLSMQIENGALSPVSKALKVGGQISLGQRSTPHT